ncbi:monocarboxylate transporter 3 isoform X2 [Erinaceus europaeus]|uniref:Monocarboxylate transporter 3 isoform X2 n=1 Tax=Erinaceus europaeus TaxID=9365 RepID=A0ABM3X7Y5_ERIEU|nr:monocarboxylate transporter 3 isoform X2 [Erinaceus europaeus]
MGAGGPQRGAGPPDGGWGWAVLGACFVITGFAYGFPKAVSVFFRELMRDFGAGYSDTAWVSSIMLAMLYGTGPVSSMLVTRFGCRPVMLVGGLLASAGMVLASFATRLLELYLTAGVLTAVAHHAGAVLRAAPAPGQRAGGGGQPGVPVGAVAARPAAAGALRLARRLPAARRPPAALLRVRRRYAAAPGARAARRGGGSAHRAPWRPPPPAPAGRARVRAARLRRVRRHQVPDGPRALRARHPAGQLRQGRGRAGRRRRLPAVRRGLRGHRGAAGVRRPGGPAAPAPARRLPLQPGAAGQRAHRPEQRTRAHLRRPGGLLRGLRPLLRHGGRAAVRGRLVDSLKNYEIIFYLAGSEVALAGIFMAVAIHCCLRRSQDPPPSPGSEGKASGTENADVAGEAGPLPARVGQHGSLETLQVLSLGAGAGEPGVEAESGPATESV